MIWGRVVYIFVSQSVCMDPFSISVLSTVGGTSLRILQDPQMFVSGSHGTAASSCVKLRSGTCVPGSLFVRNSDMSGMRDFAVITTKNAVPRVQSQHFAQEFGWLWSLHVLGRSPVLQAVGPRFFLRCSFST